MLIHVEFKNCSFGSSIMSLSQSIFRFKTTVDSEQSRDIFESKLSGKTASRTKFEKHSSVCQKCPKNVSW